MSLKNVCSINRHKGTASAEGRAGQGRTNWLLGRAGVRWAHNDQLRTYFGKLLPQIFTQIPLTNYITISEVI